MDVEYDALGRLTLRYTGTSGQASYHGEEYAFDSLARLTSAAVKTGAAPATDSLVARYYDKSGRLTREAQTIGSGGSAKNVDYTYTAAGQITTLIYPSTTRTVRYEYASNARVANIWTTGSFELARYNLGKIHDGAGRKEEALAEFQKCAELDPQFIPAILSAGQLLDGKGDYPGAIGYYERLLELDPAFKEGRVLLGNAWIRSGAPDAVSRAGEQFRIAVEIDQEYLDGVYSLAVACGLMNKIDDAARWYRRVLELAEPGSVVAVEATRFLTTQLPPPPEGASD